MSGEGARFPAAKIKRLMQADEDVGRVASGVPTIVSKCLELLATELIGKAAAAARAEQSNTIGVAHLKACTEAEEFAFLKETVAGFSAAAPPPKRPAKRSAGAGGAAMKRQCGGSGAAHEAEAAAAASHATGSAATETLEPHIGLGGGGTLAGCDDEYDDE